MTIIETLMGKGWFDSIAKEPKDSNWSYGIGKLMIILTLLFAIYYFIISAYDTSASPLLLPALGISIIFLVAMFLISLYEEKHESSSGVGFAFFGDVVPFLMQISMGVITTVFLIAYLSNSFCAEPRLVEEGYCVQTTTGQSGLLATNTELAMPLYGVILAPITEELFFRSFMFYTLITLLPSYFKFFKGNRYPIILFLTAGLIANSAFGLYHYGIGSQTCSNTQCLYDRIFISNIYGFFWLIGNQLTGGIGFGIAGHILNNMLSYKMAMPELLIYVIAPLIIVGFIVSLFLNRGKRR